MMELASAIQTMQAVRLHQVRRRRPVLPQALLQELASAYLAMEPLMHPPALHPLLQQLVEPLLQGLTLLRMKCCEY